MYKIIKVGSGKTLGVSIPAKIVRSRGLKPGDLINVDWEKAEIFENKIEPKVTQND